MSYEVWGEPDDPPELSDGWWDEDTVSMVQDAVNMVMQNMPNHAYDAEWERFGARLTWLQFTVGLLQEDDIRVIMAKKRLGLY